MDQEDKHPLEDRLNPGEHLNAHRFSGDSTGKGLLDAENKAGESYGKNVNEQAGDESTSTKSLREEEQKGSGGWNTKVHPRNPSTKKGFLKSHWKKFLPGGILAGGLGLVVLAALMLLPLKMIGLVSNITDAASKIPAYGVERRTEQILTRSFATWLIKKGNGGSITDADTAAVFCKNASIACSLTATRLNNYFDNLYDLSNFTDTNNPDGTRRVTITPKKRDRLGAFARSWEVNLETEINGEKLTRQISHIESNKEMKRYLRNHVNERMHSKSVITRYIARKALMKKYGVTNWRGFEKLGNSYAEKKALFKATIMKNTLGKIAPKASTYLSCLSGGSACDQLKDLYRADIDDGPRKTELNNGFEESQADYEKRLRRNNVLRKAAGETLDAIPVEGKMTKFISKQLVTKLGGPVAIAGVVDVIMGALENVNNGAIETIMYSVRSTAYVNYAFGDAAGIVTNVEKVKAGESVDPDLMALIAEQYEDVEKSPVFQAETALMSAGATGSGYKRTCDKDGKQEEVILKSSYVCPERQMVQSVTGFLDNPYMQLLSTAAVWWNNIVGKLFDWGDSIVGFFMEHAKINDFIESVAGDKFEDFAGWVIGLFFDVPSVGDEATGDQNYDALSAGMWVSQNGLMENGVEEGELLGGGGRLLEDEEIAAIQAEQRNEDLEFFNSQPQLARLFDTELSDSFINRFLARMPVSTFTSSAGFLKMPSSAVASLSSTLSPAAHAEVGPLNPHNMPLYGYGPGDDIFTRDPTDPIFSEESEDGCKKSAKEREESYQIRREKYPIKTYGKADPCALERLVIGNILHDMGVTNDKHSFKDPVGNASAEGGGARLNEAQVRALIKEYGLPDPKAEDSPELIVYGATVKGYENLLKQLTEGPDSSKSTWATKSLLAGEKNFMDKGGDLKEYLTTAWIWFETDPTAWPDPYQINCDDTASLSQVSNVCRPGDGVNFQASGYRPVEKKDKYIEIFKKFYGDSELPSVLQKVLDNSMNASNPSWDYKDSTQAQSSLLTNNLKYASSASPQDISPNASDFFDPKTQFLSLMLGKDPNMVIGMNSFAVSDGDLVKALKGSGYGYIKEPHRQLLSNMIFALWKFDSRFGGGAGSALPGWTVTTDPNVMMKYRPPGTVAEPAVVFKHAMLDNNISPFTVTQLHGAGNSQFAIDNAGTIYKNYDFASYGFSSIGHPGYDIGMPMGTKLYSPVNGTVVTAGGSGYFYNTPGEANSEGSGELKIQLSNGDEIIMGHMKTIDVSVGMTVTPGMFVGLSGYPEGPHLHLEYRRKDSSCSSGYCIVDPTQFIP